MTAEYYWMLPDELTGEQLYAKLGRPWVCPWCERARVPETRRSKWIEYKTNWIETPLRTTEPKWVCIGCAIDIYSDCTSRYFDEHGGTGLVDIISQSEGVNMDEFRRRCLEHQWSLIQAAPDRDTDPGYRWLIDRLRDLLGKSTDGSSRDNG